MTWRETRLKFLAEIPIRNGLGEAGGQDEPTWPRYIRTTDIAGPRSLRDDVFASLPPDVAAAAMLRRGDIVMTAAGATIGKTLLYEDPAPACYAGYLARFRPRSGVDGRFVAYWMESQPYWDQIAVGKVVSTIENFSAGKYQNMRLRIPELVEQRAIAEYLDRETARIDGLIAAKQCQLARLKERCASVTQEAIDEATTKVLPLRRLVAAFVDYRGATPAKAAMGVPLITATNVSGGGIDLSRGEQFVSEDTYDAWMRRGFPEVGDILLTTEAPLGEVAAVEDPHVALAQRIILLKPNRDRIEPDFLRVSLMSPRVQADLLSRASGSTVWGIRADRLRDVRIPVPSVSCQNVLLRRINDAEQMYAAARKLLDEQMRLLAERRSVLITAVVTGQLSIPEAA